MVDPAEEQPIQIGMEIVIGFNDMEFVERLQAQLQRGERKCQREKLKKRKVKKWVIII